MELCIPKPRFVDEDELMEEKEPFKDNDKYKDEKIESSNLPPISDSSNPVQDSGLGQVSPNGHGKPVGTFTEEELAKPTTSTTTLRPTKRPPQRPTKRPPSIQHPTQRKIFFLHSA